MTAGARERGRSRRASKVKLNSKLLDSQSLPLSMICPRQVAPSHPRGIQQAFSGDKWHPCLGPVEHRRLSRGTSVSPVLTQRKTAFSRDPQWPDSGQQRQVHDTLRKKVKGKLCVCPNLETTVLRGSPTLQELPGYQNSRK